MNMGAARERMREDRVREQVFEQLPATVRDKVQLHLQRDLFDLRLDVTLRVINRKIEATFRVYQEQMRDAAGVLIIKVPDHVLAVLSVVS